MNELEEIQAWIEAVLDAVQEIIESGEEFSDELAGEVADLISQEQEKIRQLTSLKTAPQVQSTPSNDAQLLWILAGKKEQPFISYLREFPSQETNSLLANPSLLSSTIDQLSRLIPLNEQPVANGVPHSDLQSSNIWGSKYDPMTGKMRVRFQGGSEYEYDGIPANIYRAFQKGNATAKTNGKNKYGQWWVGKNPSLGAAMNQYIKAGAFPYKKIR